MKESVKEYYGKQVQKTDDLEYDACSIADYDLKLLEPITEEVKKKRYGCGSPIPEAVSGLTVLDLGCGSGIDVFITAQLVGPAGKVIGVDMTEEQLAVANRNIDPIMKNLGYDKPNVEFIHGAIESLDLPDASIDSVLSNCVINLSTDKDAVFSELYRVLKPGGEFLIADIVADRRIPEELVNDAKLYSECLTGADYEGDFIRRMATAGFNDVRQVSRRNTKDIIEGIHFVSVTFRGFKIDLEEKCEDYGQVAVYEGTLPGSPEAYHLDRGHIFPAGGAVRICKNTADILRQSRFSEYFHVADEIAHLGLFNCSGSGMVTAGDGDSNSVSSDCC